MTRDHRSFLSRMKANGAFTDSLKAYFHRSVGLAAIGLVGVGDAYGVSPWRRARIVRRSMWNGSLTSRTSRRPWLAMSAETPAIDSLVVRPSVSSRIDWTG